MTWLSLTLYTIELAFAFAFADSAIYALTEYLKWFCKPMRDRDRPISNGRGRGKRRKNMPSKHVGNICTQCTCMLNTDTRIFSSKVHYMCPKNLNELLMMSKCIFDLIDLVDKHFDVSCGLLYRAKLWIIYPYKNLLFATSLAFRLYMRAEWEWDAWDTKTQLLKRNEI